MFIFGKFLDADLEKLVKIAPAINKIKPKEKFIQLELQIEEPEWLPSLKEEERDAVCIIEVL